MNDYLAAVNDAALDKNERLSVLRKIASMSSKCAVSEEINNHIHTIYSFSPYTPSMAAYLAREAGLAAAGSVDHDSIAASFEMIAACAVLGIGGCSGFEIRVSFKDTPFKDKKINNPDSQGIVYMTIQGVPKQSRQKAEMVLAPVREKRIERARAMAVSANALLHEAEFAQINFENDIIEKSKYAEGGGITERHLLAAMAEKITQKSGKGEQLVHALKSKFGVTVPEKIAVLLADDANPHYQYDLLGVLKAELLPRIFIQPDEHECLPAQKVTEFASEINAIASYAYLGDVGESPTGDKKAEKYEDDFIEEFFAELSRLNFKAVTYMPPRNTPEQLKKARQLSKEYGFMEISGVDINSSRQSFNCPEVLSPEFRHLIDTTWALIAHERLSSVNCRYALFSAENPLASLPLNERLALYADFGRTIDLYHPEESAALLAKEIEKGRII